MNSLVKEVLDRLVADIEAGRNPWKKSWKGGAGLPSNGVTRRTYRGINTLMLWVAEMKAGYGSSSWATFKQWGGQGRFVRKGEKGTPILFYKMLEKGEGEDARSIPMLRVSWVFNEAQLDEPAAEPQVTEPPAPEQRHAAAQEWFEGLGIEVHPGQPSFTPGKDRLMMPAASAFTSPDEYYSTLIHETVHWTGHKSRLNRLTFTVLNGSENYAREELVAEIGAAFLGAHFSIDTERNNAAYLRGWLKDLPDKREAIFTAARHASAAFEFLTTPRQQMEQAA